MAIYLKGDNQPVEKMIKRLGDLGVFNAEHEDDIIHIYFNGTYDQIKAIILQIEKEFKDDMDGWY